MTDKRKQGTALEDSVRNVLRSCGVVVNATANSGAVKEDGDLHTRDYAFDCKSQHDYKGKPLVHPRIDVDDFAKISDQAYSTGKTPVLVVDNSRGQIFAVMDIHEFAQLLSMAVQQENV